MRHQDPSAEPCPGAGWQRSVSPSPHLTTISALGAVACGATWLQNPKSLQWDFSSEGGADSSLNALWRWKCSFHRFPAHAPPVRSHTRGNQSSESSLTLQAFRSAFSPAQRMLLGGHSRGTELGDVQLCEHSSASLPAALRGSGFTPTVGMAD